MGSPCLCESDVTLGIVGLSPTRIIFHGRKSFRSISQIRLLLKLIIISPVFRLQLCDSDMRETAWLIMVDTVREMTKLVNSLKTVWEGELMVELPSEVLPFCVL